MIPFLSLVPSWSPSLALLYIYYAMGFVTVNPYLCYKHEHFRTLIERTLSQTPTVLGINSPVHWINTAPWHIRRLYESYALKNIHAYEYV